MSCASDVLSAAPTIGVGPRSSAALSAHAASDQVIDELDLEATGTAWFGDAVSLRWVLIHMIEETARHAGHVDILRELIDGMTGDHRPD